LSAAPLSHLYGLYNINCAFAAGAAMVMLPAFSPPDLARVVEATQPTAIFMGPAHASAFKGTDILRDHDFSSVKYSVFSGAYSPPDVMTYWGEQTGSALCQLWGMTELAAGTFSRPGMDAETATRSAGPAAPGNEVRVVSAETGEPLSTDEEGELQVRGASVFPGYLNNPDANAEAFTSEGWFRTGDLATIDGQGNLTITGRIKDIINRGGVKYNPSDIEEIIFTHPKVALTAIVPMKDAKLGERACCFVQLVPGETTDLGEITAFLTEQNISKNKWPERLEVIEDMPLTPTRKVIKGKLAALLED
jgi:acyl-CoA synthetase (AMP-forming)/AMP-acid ligase II